MSDIVIEAWPPSRRGSEGSRSFAVPLAAAAMAIAGLVAIAGLAVRDRQSGAVAPAIDETRPPPVARWLDIIKPVEVYSLVAPELADASFAYKARRLNFGAGREDTLTYGKLAGDRPSLRLRLYRGDGAALDSALAFATLTHMARPAVVKSANAGPLSTRFGRFDTADLELRDVSAKVAVCTAFRLGVGKPGLSVTGVACGSAGKQVPRDDLACLINRLDLASAGEDRALADFFAAAELRRNATCAGMRLRPDSVHAAWLDDKPATGLKNLRRR